MHAFNIHGLLLHEQNYFLSSFTLYFLFHNQSLCAEAFAWRYILFKSTTGISHEHLNNTAPQGEVANCTFQVGLSGVHS